ncbi:MAG: alpha/beta hydrolase [Desulfobacterales bacterium]|nr:alpha/beta hydrolase [Desulfobacterales bacterium]
MKGTMGALKFDLLEQIVDFEEAFVHPSVNLATNYARFALAHPLVLADCALENYKTFLGLSQALLGMPLAGQKEINMVNPQRQLDYLHNATQNIAPMKTALPFYVEWEDERAEMLTCDIDNGVNDNPVIIYVAYTGRSAALADYNDKFNPQKRSSLSREFINNGFGPVSIFTCKNPLKKNLHHATPEYLSSVHSANQYLKDLTGFAPHIVGLCQMGYFNAWNLSDNPDDANTFVLAGAPFDPRRGSNFIKKFADSLSMQDIEDYLKLSGNRMSAKRMAKGWRLMADPNYYIGSSKTATIGNRHITLFRQMLDDDFSPERDYVFKSWMDKDVVSDIAGGLYRDLVSFFKFGIKAACIADKDFSRITCPTAVLSGGKDDISPEETCVAIFDCIKSHIKTHFHNPLVGHTGIYNSEKAITDRYDTNNWQAIMLWMKENSKYR